MVHIFLPYDYMYDNRDNHLGVKYKLDYFYKELIIQYVILDDKKMSKTFIPNMLLLLNYWLRP